MKTSKIVMVFLVFIFLSGIFEPFCFAADDGSYYEVGIWWETYPNGPPPDPLPYSDDEARSFSETLADDGWTELIDRGNTDSGEVHWVKPSAGGSDNSYIDTCDIVWFNGHGSSPTTFYVGYTSSDLDTVEASECYFGDGDLEWVFLNSCYQLDSYYSNWDGAFAGFHGICGYRTVGWQDDTYLLGEKTAEVLLTEECMGDSWKDSTKWFYDQIDQSVSAAIYRAKIQKPDTTYFDYYYESQSYFWPDYGAGGYTLYQKLYTYWSCP